MSVCSSFEVGDKSKALVQVEVILNPLTETAQKWSTMLRVSLLLPETAAVSQSLTFGTSPTQVLSSLDHVHLRVLLLPALQATEVRQAESTGRPLVLTDSSLLYPVQLPLKRFYRYSMQSQLRLDSP